MNKRDLVAAMQAEGLSRIESIKAVEGFVGTIVESLSRGEKVSLIGFGAFSLVKHRPRTKRNPRTGEKVAVPAHSTVTFRSGKSLYDQVNQNTEDKA